VAAAWLITSPRGSSSRLATAASPRKPMPIEASVIPTWQVERYSSILSTSSSARSTPRAPSSFSASSLSRRARTSANSAATKKPFSATSTTTASRNRASVTREPLSAGCYFEEVRRRSSRATVRTLALRPAAI
jgi:hypothetical protein